MQMQREPFNANQIQFELWVSQWPADLFFVQEFAVNDYALSQSYSIQLSVTTTYQIDSEALIESAASLVLHWPPDKAYLHGIIQSIDYLGYSLDQQHYAYQLLLVSPLHILKNQQITRLFLQKTALEIAQEILQAAGFSVNTWKIVAQENYPIKPLAIQYQETTYDFFTRLLSQYGLFFWFEQSDAGAILWIVNDIKQLPTFPDESLPYRSESGQVSMSGNIANFYEIANWLPQQISLQGYGLATRDYDQLVSATANNATEIIGAGQFIQSVRGLDNSNQAQILAQNLQQHLDGQRNQFILATNCPGLQLGQQIKLIEHPHDNYNATYRVVAMQIAGKQTHLRLLGDSHSVDKFTYQATATVWPADRPYRVWLQSRPHFHHILVATVESTRSELPHLDELGRYLVRFAFDNSDTPAGQASPPLPFLQPYGGPPGADGAQGWHMALRPGTQVAVGFLEGDLEQPIILGTIHHPGNPSTVTNANATQQVIRTATGQTFLVEDQPEQNYLLLAGANQQQRLELNAIAEQHSIRVISETGAVTAFAQKDLQITTQAQHVRQSEQNILVTAEQNYQLQTQQGGITQQAGKDLQLQAGRDLRLQAKNSIALQAGQDLQINTGNSASFQVNQGDLQILAPQGNLQLQAQQNILVRGESGAIQIGQPSGGIIMTPAGNLQLIGNQITFEAPEINIHGLATASTVSPLNYPSPPIINSDNTDNNNSTNNEPSNNMDQYDEFHMFVAIVWGEAASQSEVAWKAIGSVIMNRVGRGEYKKYNSVTKIIEFTGFDAYNHKDYLRALNYLNNDNLPNGSLRPLNNYEVIIMEKMIAALRPIYYQKAVITNADHYYSPRNQAMHHGRKPIWAVDNKEVHVIGLSPKDDFKFYKLDYL